MKKQIIINHIALNISITCNTNCKRCYRHLDYFETCPTFMNFETTKKSIEIFLEQLPDSGGEIMFFGGEPLMNWDLMEKVITWYDTLGLPPNIGFVTSTNGLDLTKERIDFLAKFNVRHNYCLSLDGDYKIYSENRKISRKEYDRIIEMLCYGLRNGNNFWVPYCVLNKKNISRTYEILSFLVSLGVFYINIGRDLYEDWTQEDRDEVVFQANKVSRDTGVIIVPFTECLFDCTTCYAPSIMVYPNGDIYDSCYPMASVLRDRGIITEEKAQLLKIGNVNSFEGFYLDIEAKRKLITPYMKCPIVHPNIFLANQKLLNGVKHDSYPTFRVMEVLDKKLIEEYSKDYFSQFE